MNIISSGDCAVSCLSYNSTCNEEWDGGQKWRKTLSRVTVSVVLLKEKKQSFLNFCVTLATSSDWEHVGGFVCTVQANNKNEEKNSCSLTPNYPRPKAPLVNFMVFPIQLFISDLLNRSWREQLIRKGLWWEALESTLSTSLYCFSVHMSLLLHPSWYWKRQRDTGFFCSLARFAHRYSKGSSSFHHKGKFSPSESPQQPSPDRAKDLSPLIIGFMWRVSSSNTMNAHPPSTSHFIHILFFFIWCFVIRRASDVRSIQVMFLGSRAQTLKRWVMSRQKK